MLDTDILVDFIRGFPPAVAWLTNYALPVGVPGLVRMELLQGCKNMADQTRIEKELRKFSLHWPSVLDCERALSDFASFRLSHGIQLLDTLIGQTAVGLGEPLATFNVKHYSVIAGLKLVQPY